MMSAIVGLVSLNLLLQIPSPSAGTKASEALRQEYVAIFGAERKSLEALLETLAGNAEAIEIVKKALPLPPRPDKASRFVPNPDVAGPAVDPLALLSNSKEGPATAWRAEFLEIRSKAATGAFKLSQKALTSSSSGLKHYALADALLREVIARDPNHAEARRLLGQVAHEGGWATPYAVQQLEKGMTLHPKYGWVKRSWVPHLENGELPAIGTGAIEGKERWLPDLEANRQRRDFAKGWRIETEHFKIQTNVPLDEAIAFGRHLETFHQLFQSLMADVIGEGLPLAKRFRQKAGTGGANVEVKPGPLHVVSYFAERNEYVEALRPFEGDDAELSLGIYLPPRSNRSKRGQAYFFRDEGGELAVTATLFHEVSHQLLMESDIGKANDFRKNTGNYWVFEGLGTYFETVTLNNDGSVLVGGFVGPRLLEARKNLYEKRLLTPLSQFVAFDENDFKSENIYQRYQQAEALATFLMQDDRNAYRDDFLIYVRDACLGRLGTNGRSLEERLRLPISRLENRLLNYLKEGAGGEGADPSSTRSEK